MRWKRRVAVGLAATVLTCLGSGCGANDVASTSDDPALTASSRSDLERSFAVFRRRRGLADAIPRYILPREVAAAVGLDLRNARLARTYGTKRIYLATSSRLICIYSDDPAIGNCWPVSTVRRNLATATSVCDLGNSRGSIVTYGMVSDGISGVEIPRGDGLAYTAGVVGNVYVVQSSSAPPLPRYLLLVGRHSTLKRPTGIPPRLAKRGCVRRQSGSL